MGFQYGSLRKRYIDLVVNYEKKNMVEILKSQELYLIFDERKSKIRKFSSITCLGQDLCPLNQHWKCKKTHGLTALQQFDLLQEFSEAAYNTDEKFLGNTESRKRNFVKL